MYNTFFKKMSWTKGDFGEEHLNEKLFKFYAKQTCGNLELNQKIINNQRINLKPVLALVLKALLLQNLWRRFIYSFSGLVSCTKTTGVIKWDNWSKICANADTNVTISSSITLADKNLITQQPFSCH